MISQKIILGLLKSFMQAPDNAELTFLLSGRFYARGVLLNLNFCLTFFRPIRLFNDLRWLNAFF